MKYNEVANRTKIAGGLGKAQGIVSFMIDYGTVPSDVTYEFLRTMLESALKEIEHGLWGVDAENV